MAVHVLLMWLFVLATGIVHACMVQPALQSTAIAAAPAGHCQEAVAEDEDAAPVAAVDHRSDGTKPPCERLCDGPSAVTQAEKQQSNPAGTFWLASAPVASFIFQPVAESGRQTDSGPQTGRDHPVPIPIAFLRLAL